MAVLWSQIPDMAVVSDASHGPQKDLIIIEAPTAFWFSSRTPHETAGRVGAGAAAVSRWL